jgi:hypothetical protein
MILIQRTDHRMTSKPCKSVKHSIAENRPHPGYVSHFSSQFAHSLRKHVSPIGPIARRFASLLQNLLQGLACELDVLLEQFAGR